MEGGKYQHLTRDELVRLLVARDRRDATRFGLVWEANEIERDKAINADFVALDLDPELSTPQPEGGWSNLIIEGDNFDALRYLTSVHRRRRQRRRPHRLQRQLWHLQRQPRRILGHRRLLVPQNQHRRTQPRPREMAEGECAGEGVTELKIAMKQTRRFECSDMTVAAGNRLCDVAKLSDA